MPEKPKVETFKFAELPEVADQDVIVLLCELATVTEIKDEAIKSETELKLKLENMQRALGYKGMRHKGYCFVAREMPGRKTLDKALLIVNGVSTDQIEASMKEGKPFVERRFEVIEPK